MERHGDDVYEQFRGRIRRITESDWGLSAALAPAVASVSLVGAAPRVERVKRSKPELPRQPWRQFEGRTPASDLQRWQFAC